MKSQENKDLFAITIGENIRKSRLKHMMTINELAESANIDEKNLNRIELGERVPSTYTLAKIAGALSINPGDLYKGTLELLDIIPKDHKSEQ